MRWVVVKINNLEVITIAMVLYERVLFEGKERRRNENVYLNTGNNNNNNNSVHQIDCGLIKENRLKQQAPVRDIAQNEEKTKENDVSVSAATAANKSGGGLDVDDNDNNENENKDKVNQMNIKQTKRMN